MANLHLNPPILQTDFISETGTLRNFEPLKMEELKVKIEHGKFAITKWVILASILFILLFLGFSFYLIINNNSSVCNNPLEKFIRIDPVDKLIKVYLEVIPFWATITGTILGYHFVKKDS